MPPRNVSPSLVFFSGQAQGTGAANSVTLGNASMPGNTPLKADAAVLAVGAVPLYPAVSGEATTGGAAPSGYPIGGLTQIVSIAVNVRHNSLATASLKILLFANDTGIVATQAAFAPGAVGILSVSFQSDSQLPPLRGGQVLTCRAVIDAADAGNFADIGVVVGLHQIPS